MAWLIHFSSLPLWVLLDQVQNTNKSNNFILELFSDMPKVLPAPSSISKRYVSSFKTLINSTSNKQTQRLNYINDSVVIFKLSKERKRYERRFLSIIFYLIDTNHNSQPSSKQSSLSTRTSSTAGSSSKQQQQQQAPPPPPPPLPPVIRLSPVLKIEGQSNFN